MEDNHIDNANPSELEQMRRQLALLKEKLDKEEFVNDRLLRESMKSKADTVNRQGVISFAAGVWALLIVGCFWVPMGFSLTFCIVTVLMMIICMVDTWRIHRPVNSQLLSGDLLTVAKTMLKVKKAYQRWLFFGIPMALGWIVYLGFEIYRFTGHNWGRALPIIIAGLVGGLIGGIIGLRMHKKVVHTCDDMVRQIESIQPE